MNNYEQQAKDLNFLNKSTKNILKMLLPELKKFEGKKIYTQNGFVKNFISRPYKSENKPLQYYLQKETYSIILNVKVWSNNEKGITSYSNKSIWLCDIKDYKLDEVFSLSTLVERMLLDEKYTAKKIATQIAKLEKAQKNLSNLYYKLDSNIIEKNFIRRY